MVVIMYIMLKHWKHRDETFTLHPDQGNPLVVFLQGFRERELRNYLPRPVNTSLCALIAAIM